MGSKTKRHLELLWALGGVERCRVDLTAKILPGIERKEKEKEQTAISPFPSSDTTQRRLLCCFQGKENNSHGKEMGPLV